VSWVNRQNWHAGVAASRLASDAHPGELREVFAQLARSGEGEEPLWA
jgi:hypothetical protein